MTTYSGPEQRLSPPVPKEKTTVEGGGYAGQQLLCDQLTDRDKDSLKGRGERERPSVPRGAMSPGPSVLS